MSTRQTLRTALAPRWWPWHLLLVVAVGAMGWLGWWQLQSFEDADPPAASGATGTTAAVPLDRLTAPGDRIRPGDPGRTVTADGTWEGGSQVTVPGRERDGRRGALVVTPLRTARGIVPVVRGWVPAGAGAPAPPGGRVTVRGVLQRSETEADATTVVPADGEVGYVATVTLLAAPEYAAYDPDRLYDGFVVLRSARPALTGDAPALVAADRRGDDGSGQVGAWRNLAYAVQWWLFAAFAVFFWAVVLRRAAKEEREDQPEQPPGPPTAGPRGPGAALSAPPRRT